MVMMIVADITVKNGGKHLVRFDWLFFYLMNLIHLGRQLIAEGYLSEVPIQNSYSFKVVLSC